MKKRIINFFRWTLHKLRVLYRKVMAGKGTPHQIALGAAIGIFVALTPTVGLQMIIAVIIAKLFGANWLVAAPMAWLTNPVTAPPYFYGTYKLGLSLMGGEEGYDVFGKIIELAEKAAQGNMLTFFGEMFKLTHDILLPLWIGSIVVATVVGLGVYPVVLRMVVGYRADRKKRRHKWVAALRHEIAKKLHLGHNESAEQPKEE